MAHTKGRSSRCAFQPRPKKKAPAARPPRPAKAPLPAAQLAHHQLLLRVFASTFAAELSSHNLHNAIQDVKKALFERDFAAAFTNADSLPSYAARWSPTRAACYSGLLAELEWEELMDGRPCAEKAKKDDDDEESDNGSGDSENGNGDLDPPNPTTTSANPTHQQIEIVALGGGAAELAALGSMLALNPGLTAQLTILDSGPWAAVLDRLQAGLITPPALSKYASASAHAANHALLDSPARLAVRFEQVDVLGLAGTARTHSAAGSNDADSEETDVSPAALRKAIYGSSTAPGRKVLITLLFTLNELYASSRGKTTMLLLSLTELLPAGSLLLILDSPGSYSEAAVGKEMRRYPMKLLVEHTLLREERGAGNDKKWEMVESEDSAWFRLPDGLEYPIPLENMRYQKHLYRLVAPASNSLKE
ncbi:25S rRNA (uridine(2843)-N(3))-methyltransferase [Ceratocystis fimbriata CBS 114723]|uniref:25S rRNA (Uridine(2843)-N(3))-methyltransferase n=1 Tax=Ceratocystis fimbriata CBS 114723 TaxID=1035309 RepID=A0A2C5X9R5_9PEZI|nr:25S rRNA (uridine(2843)-N(3))-methyltransferase [Ceratocystis fimbriata CBS 114723]